MAAEADKKKQSVSLSLFMDVSGLEVEEELSTMATVCWAEGVRMGRWEEGQREYVGEANLRSTNMEASERPSRGSPV